MDNFKRNFLREGFWVIQANADRNRGLCFSPCWLHSQSSSPYVVTAMAPSNSKLTWALETERPEVGITIIGLTWVTCPSVDQS